MSEFCVILVMIPPGAVATAAGSFDPISNSSMDLILGCKGCIKQKVLTIPEGDLAAVALSSFVAQPGGDCYLLRFSNYDTAALWFAQNKNRLPPGTEVKVFDPAT